MDAALAGRMAASELPSANNAWNRCLQAIELAVVEAEFSILLLTSSTC